MVGAVATVLFQLNLDEFNQSKSNTIVVVQQAIVKQQDKSLKTIQPILVPNKTPSGIHMSTLTPVTKPIILHNSLIVIGQKVKEKPLTKSKKEKEKLPVPKTAPCPCQAKPPCTRKPPYSKSNPPCPKETKQDKACHCQTKPALSPTKIPPSVPKVNDNEPDILQTIKK